MRSIVREHNLLTGYRFVIVEYVLVSVVLGALGVYFLAVTRWIDAGIWLGIVVNLHARLPPWRSRRSAAARLRTTEAFRCDAASSGARVGRDHPRLVRRTTVLVTITFIPFLLALLVIVDPDRAGSPSAA